MNQFELNEQRIAELAEIISDTPARVEDVLIDQHNAPLADVETIGYEIVNVTVYRRSDPLNLPAYRAETVITVRWVDADSTRPIGETFYGWGVDHNASDAQAETDFSRWNERMNRIGQHRAQVAQ